MLKGDLITINREFNRKKWLTDKTIVLEDESTELDVSFKASAIYFLEKYF